MKKTNFLWVIIALLLSCQALLGQRFSALTELTDDPADTDVMAIVDASDATATKKITFDNLETAVLRSTGRALVVLTGTIDPTASTAVVGVGTLFTTEIEVGDRIVVSGETRGVTAIADDENLTVGVAFSDVANDTSPDVLSALVIRRTADGTPSVIINNLGNVGIGTADPTEKLTVVGNITASGTIIPGSSASKTTGFIDDGGVTNIVCGASNQGRMIVMDDGTFELCDGATTSVRRVFKVESAIDHDALLNFVAGEHILEASLDHDALTNFVANEHLLTAAIDHDALLNFVAGEHILEASLDHDALTNFVAGEHVDHTASHTTNFVVDGGVTSLTCGASNQGRFQVMDDGTFELCDGATTSVLRVFSTAGASNSFETWNAPAGTDPVADSATDTVNFTAGGGLTITGTSSTDTIDFTIGDVETLTTSFAANRVPYSDASNLISNANFLFDGTTLTAPAFATTGTTEGVLSLLEASTNGANFLSLTAPAAITANGDCLLLDVTARFIPQGCLEIIGSATLGTDSVSADELNAAGVATELEAVLDHDALTNFVANEHLLTAAIDHDALLNFVAGEHVLEASIDHDALTNFVAGEHVDHTASHTTNFVVDGGVTSLTCGGGNQGRFQVMDDGTFELCDGATTSVLRVFQVESAIDHDALTNFVANEHLLTAAIDHDALLNFVAGEHILEASLDHDALTNFVAGEHVDHTASHTTNFVVDGGAVSLTCGASNQGRLQVMDDGTFEMCDGATTSVLRVFSTAGGSASNSFETWNTPSGTNPVADSATDTINFEAGTGVTVTGTSGTDTINISLALGSIDHDALLNFVANEHLLTAAIDHDALLNFVAGEHVLEASIDHDALTNFVAGEHVDHTASHTTNFVVDGGVTSLTCGGGNQGRFQVMDDGTFELCDGATTSVLRVFQVESAIDHDALTNFVANEHLLTAAIDHDALLNFVAGEHILEASLDHDALTNFVAGEHVDHTASHTTNFVVDGGVTGLTCGASNQGRIQVLDDGTLQACDGATTSVQQTFTPGAHTTARTVDGQGIELSGDELSIELDGATLAKGASGLSVLLAPALTANPASTTGNYCADRAADCSCATQEDLDDLGGTVSTTQAEAALVTNVEPMTIDPTVAASGEVQIKWSTAVTVTDTRCDTDAGTVEGVNFEERVATTPSTAGTDVHTSDYTADTNQQIGGSIANATIAAYAPLALTFGTVTTATILRCYITFTID